MPIYMATAFFELRGHGWSESYFRDGGGETDLAALADFDRLGLWTKRAKCLGKQATCFAQRVSFSDVLGDSVLNYLTLPGNSGFDAEDPNTALLVRFGDATNTHFKNTFMRGIADDVVVQGGDVGRGFALFQAAYNGFVDAVLQGTYGWMGSAVKTQHPLTGYVSDPENRIVFTTAAPALPAADVNGLIRVRGKNIGVGGKSILNKTMVCSREGDNTCTTKKAQAAFPFMGKACFLVTRTTTLRVIRNARLQKVVERKAGKVSYTSAGRLAARIQG